MNATALPEARPERTRTKEPPLLLRVEEAARLLGLGRTKVYELIARGELRAIKVDAATRVPRAELDAWIAARAGR